MRWFAALVVVVFVAPSVAVAKSNMPQMDFSNPLTASQVVWMAIILVALYLVLSRWGLPGMAKVLAARANTIAVDLETARAAKAAADRAVAELNRTMMGARGSARAEIADAVARAKAKALGEAQVLKARLDEQLDESERQIDVARAAALAAIKPVAASVAGEILQRLTGRAPDALTLAGPIDAAYSAREAA